MVRLLAVLLLCTSTTLAYSADPVPPVKAKLDGTWIFDTVNPTKSRGLNRVWMSIVTIEGDSFSISNIMRNPASLKGKIAFDKANPKHVDIANDELDFSYFGGPFKWSASKRKALFEFVDRDRIRFAIPLESSAPRPANFQPSESNYVIELCRAPKGFKEFPEEIKVSVENSDGKPVEGAIVTPNMHQEVNSKLKDAKQGWQFAAAKTTGKDGTVKASMWDPPFVIRHEKTKEMAIPKITPATLASGSIRVVLAPECRVVSSIRCDELTKAGQPLDWTITMLESNGMTMGSYSHPDGKIEFLLPPGTYTLNPYGESLHGRYLEVTVPPLQSTFEMKPIELKASATTLMKGKPAPEFVNVVGWTRKPVKLADLKGQYVLIEFWGYWCGPCVHAMPTLIELHEKFHDKGLTIIGVHVDTDGDVPTVAKYDEMNAEHVKSVWKGKKLPFTNALVSGQREGEGDNRVRGGTPKLYGILGYPTTVLIDREGKIVGRFNARDSKVATAEIEKLLGKKKK